MLRIGKLIIITEDELEKYITDKEDKIWNNAIDHYRTKCTQGQILAQAEKVINENHELNEENKKLKNLLNSFITIKNFFKD